MRSDGVHLNVCRKVVILATHVEIVGTDALLSVQEDLEGTEEGDGDDEEEGDDEDEERQAKNSETIAKGVSSKIVGVLVARVSTVLTSEQDRKVGEMVRLSAVQATLLLETSVLALPVGVGVFLVDESETSFVLL